MATIHGVCDERFAAVGKVLSDSIDSRADLGASVAVVLDGEFVVDIWGGSKDADHTEPWAQDTITNVWSTTKTMMALSALVLVDRGELDVFAPVSKYWPEFAANGKSGVEVRHLLSHTSGVSGWAQPFVIEDLYDWEKSTALLAAQEPWWEPGTASGYHLLSQGHLVGEVVRRITGQKLGAFFAQEIAGPLGADFHIGLAPEHHGRVSNVIPPAPTEIDFSTVDFTSVAMKSYTGPVPQAEVSWTSAWREADISAANGHGNARSVARVQSVVAGNGEVDGIRLLSPSTIDLIFQQQSQGIDLVLAEPLQFGIGYALPPSMEMANLPEGKICFWGGWGGSKIVVDVGRNLTIAYMMNRMVSGLLGDPRASDLVDAVYASVGR